jgi:molybdenum cofactor biosynthesis enzyme MoaA
VKIHRWLDLKVTRRCNNTGRKCNYCAVPVEPPDAPERLPLDVVRRTLMDARRLGFDIFWFLGGEPSLREDAPSLFEPLGDDREVALTVVTNGRLENWAMVEALFATRARRACVQVSLDTLSTPNPKHAEPDKVLDYVRRLRDVAARCSSPAHECAVEVHAVISRANLHDFDGFARFMAGRRVPASLAMVCPWRVSDAPARLDEFTRDELLDVVRRIDGLRTGLPIDEFNPLVAEFIRRMLDGRPDARPCGAGLTHLVVNADGAVHRCMAESFRPATALGNLTEQRLHAILRQVTGPARCDESPECFDGFAWDRLALG